MDGHSHSAESGRCYCGQLLDMFDINVAPTTGGIIPVTVASSDTVEYLKKMLSKKLRVAKERICLLFRDRHLREGTLSQNNITEGSKITLLPSVETGLLTQRPEQSVMQALESLNDGQVNDFLSGKAPLNLSMRLGDHMMLIQLQLSTVSPTGSRKSRSHDHHQHYYKQNHCGHSYYHQRPSPPKTPYDPPAASPITFSQVPHQSLYTPPRHHHVHHCSPSSNESPLSSSSFPIDSDPLIRGCPHSKLDAADPKAALDTKALAEASRNLTQTLKQLSNEVMTPKSRTPVEKEVRVRNLLTPKIRTPVENESFVSQPTEKTATVSSSSKNQICGINVNKPTSLPSAKAAKRQGAIIESMHHHGKGVYSGTFSGTLNPALQDRQGRPKRDISTIIHILNDLLCATPQYRRSSKSSNSSKKSNQVAHPKVVSQPSVVEKIVEESPSLDSQVTRKKLEQLRQSMEQRQARRKARREARAMPYPNTSTTPKWSSDAKTTWSSETVVAEEKIEVDCKNSDEDKLCGLESGTIVA